MEKLHARITLRSDAGITQIVTVSISPLIEDPEENPELIENIRERYPDKEILSIEFSRSSISVTEE